MLWDGTPHVNPLTGEVSTLPYAGDPVSGRGWIDPLEEPSGDRRLFLASGPFTFAPGDSQEVFVAVMAAQGTDNLNSIVRLRELAAGVRRLFQNWWRFDQGALFTPSPPPPPDVQVAELPGRVVLSWNARPESYSSVQGVEPSKNASGYRFQGYNVYQLDAGDAEEATFVCRMVTFDLPDGVRKIRDRVFLPTIGEEVEVTVQHGTDSGIRHFLVVDEDSLLHRPLVNGRTYYFGVSSYAYNPEGSGTVLPHALEGRLRVVAATPHDPVPGTVLTYQVLDTVAFAGPSGARNAEHSGKSRGTVVALAIDPLAMPTAEYQVTFAEQGGQVCWNLSRDGTRLVMAQTNQSGDWNYPIVDGLLVKVIGPPFAFASNAESEAAGIVEVSYAGQPVPPGGWDVAGAPYEGNSVWHSVSWSGADGQADRFFISGGSTGRLSDLTRNIRKAVPHDYELRFSDRGSLGWWKFEGDVSAPVPFELWDIGVATPVDPADDQQLIPVLHSGGHTVGIFDISETTPDPRSGWPATDRIFFYADPRGYAAFAADAEDGTVDDTTFGRTELIADVILADFDKDGRLPPPGTVIRFNTTKPNLPGDRFSFEVSGPGYQRDLARQQIQRINVFPNPYYAQNLGTLDPLQGHVTFTHLPERATIRIFTLAGDLVRTIEHHDPSTLERWDLRNQAGTPVASGIYLVHVAMPGLGEKVLKLAVFQPVWIPPYSSQPPEP